MLSKVIRVLKINAQTLKTIYVLRFVKMIVEPVFLSSNVYYFEGSQVISEVYLFRFQVSRGRLLSKRRHSVSFYKYRLALPTN